MGNPWFFFEKKRPGIPSLIFSKFSEKGKKEKDIDKFT